MKRTNVVPLLFLFSFGLASASEGTPTPDTPVAEQAPPASEGQPTPPAKEEQPTPPTAATKEDPQDEVVCYRDPATGTRIAKRVCMTRREYDQRTRESQEALGEIRSKSGSQPRPGSR